MAKLKIFNSLTRKKEEFLSKDKKVGIYVCGITPYDVTHLGHAFTYVSFDVVVRYLRYLDYQVIYVQNLTDIDDDILKKAKESKENWRKLVEKNTQRFLEDMRWLNCLQPDVYPRATDHIKEIIEIIQKLERKKMAYEKEGNVYYSVGDYKNYGELSKLPRKVMLPIANQRGNNPKDPNKKNPLDFVLWQAKKPGEPVWLSPWGQGRPGWHIECSAMAKKYLGETIDIQGGGADLIFPHHESSAALSETADQKPFSRYWLHTGMLSYKGKKMSKSLGNLVLVDDLKKRYNSNAIRLFLLSHRYRAKWEFKEEGLKKIKKLTELFKKVWRAQSESGKPLDISGYEKNFFQAMNDDFNTALAIKILRNLAKQILKNKKEKNISDAKAFLNKAFNILGLVIEL